MCYSSVEETVLVVIGGGVDLPICQRVIAFRQFLWTVLSIYKSFPTIYLSFHTAAPSFEYYVQLRCQCKNKRKFVGDKKCNSET